MAEVEDCLRVIICELLGPPVRAILSDALNSVAVALQAQVAAIEAQLLILNIPAQVAQTAISIVEAARAELLANLNFILPLTAIEQCFDAGKLREYLALPLAVLDADFTELTEEYVQALSIIDDLNFLKREIEELLEFAQEVVLAISECGA